MVSPYRLVLHKKSNKLEMAIDWTHELSDGFGIPALVINCPLSKKFSTYRGNDEYGEEVKGISFDDCVDCSYFMQLGFGQEINCLFRVKQKKRGNAIPFQW